MKFHNPLKSYNFSVLFITFLLILCVICAGIIIAPKITASILFGSAVSRVAYYMIKGE